MAGDEASRSDRLRLSQFLHPTSHICREYLSRGYHRSYMRGWETGESANCYRYFTYIDGSL